MIKPTVGRMIWYYPQGATQLDAEHQPLAAIVAHVNEDESVNIAYFNHLGAHQGGALSVPILKDGEPAPESAFCMWMPYQLGQAAKAEALQAALSDADPPVAPTPESSAQATSTAGEPVPEPVPATEPTPAPLDGGDAT